MRMKSILALSILSASTFFSVVGQAHIHQNFLLGGELGYARQKENFNAAYTIPAVGINTFPNPDSSVMVTDQGIMFGLIAGWQFRCQRVMLGLEANVDFESFEENRPFAFMDNVVNTSVLTGNILYERGPIYALTARAGYFITPGFMPYVRLGGQGSRDELNFEVLISPAGLADFSSNKKTNYGGVAGIGVEFPSLIGPSTFRLEWTYTKTDKVIIKDNTPPMLGSYDVHNPKPETSIVKAAWVWNFV